MLNSYSIAEVQAGSHQHGLFNAAPEWQAGSLGWHSRKSTVACPLEGLVMWSLGLNDQALLPAFFEMRTVQAK